MITKYSSLPFKVIFTLLAVEGRADIFFPVYPPCVLLEDDGVDSILPYKDSFEFAINGDTLSFAGKITMHCCGSHFIRQYLSGDTLFFQRVDTGNICRCYCMYNFSLEITNCTFQRYRVILLPTDNLPTLDTLIDMTTNIERGENIDNKDCFAHWLKCNPNPFSPQTTITFSGTQDREAVKLNIIDPTGRVVRTMSGSANGGKVSYVWDGTDQNRKALARGVYVANVVSKGVNMKKLLVLTR